MVEIWSAATYGWHKWEYSHIVWKEIVNIIVNAISISKK